MIQNDVLGNAKAEGRAEGRTEEKYKIALSLLEQVFEGDDTLEATGIFIVFQSEGRDERHDGGLSYFGFLHEGGKLVSQNGIISFIDNEIGVVEFHLTDVDESVGSIDDHVGLCPAFFLLTVPWQHFCLYTLDAQCPLDLWYMTETEVVKGKTSPSIQFGGVLVLLPVTFVGRIPLELETEEKEWVCQLVL